MWDRVPNANWTLHLKHFQFLDLFLSVETTHIFANANQNKNFQQSIQDPSKPPKSAKK